MLEDPEKFEKSIEEEAKRIQHTYFSGKRKLGRNELCHCSSGIKYKKCCLEKDVKKYGHAIKIWYFRKVIFER